MSEIVIHPDVEQSLRESQPIVALESAVTTAGLPRVPHDPPAIDDFAIKTALLPWKKDSPVNLETARAMQRAIAHGGAMPAKIAVLNGQLRIGLDDQEIEQLACDTNAGKCSAGDMAACMTCSATAGTTVSATLAAIEQAGKRQPGAGNQQPGECDSTRRIRVFATGGIGGVHRNWNIRPDISTDLISLSRTPVCVVCSGAKSLLDLPATVEALESLGVPVIGYRTNYFPCFIAGVDQTLPLRNSCDAVKDIAAICRAHWGELGFQSAVLVVQPVPAGFALDDKVAGDAVTQAENAADKKSVVGPARTPFVLEEVNRLTGGRSLKANIALLLNNAALAAKLAIQLRDL